MIPTHTLSRFIRAEERKISGTTGELTDLLTAVGLGVKYIHQLVQTAGLKGIKGYTGKVNVQGEVAHKIDAEADEILVKILGSSGHFGLLVSEERDTVIATDPGSENAGYVLAFDPLDGSSNLDTSVPVGTIFTIYRKREKSRKAAPEDFLQKGRSVVAAGYAVYGAKTSFVYSCGNGVHDFTLDPSLGEFVLTEESLKSPERGSVYSVNEGYRGRWDAGTAKFVAELTGEDSAKGTPYSARYAGSLVVDFDRNLRRGGVYLYPADKKNPQGKLRLLYECVPLAFIAEQAGARAIDGKRAILDIVPENIHQRCPLIIGSRHEVDWYEASVR